MAVLLHPVWFVLSVLFVSHAFPVSLILCLRCLLFPPLLHLMRACRLYQETMYVSKSLQHCTEVKCKANFRN